MHYYQFNIGDYASHTKGLSLLEDLAYRRLIDEYYLAERPLNGCSTTVARRIGFRDHVDAVDYVLTTFFVQKDDSWVHERIESDLDTVKRKIDNASLAGKKSAEKRKKPIESPENEQSFNDRSTTVEPPFNYPIPNTQYPNTLSTPKRRETETAFNQFWEAYPKKVGKDAASKSFAKRIKDGVSVEAMTLALAKQRESPDWQRDDGRFIPNPATWLNQGRWMDEGVTLADGPAGASGIGAGGI